MEISGIVLTAELIGTVAFSLSGSVLAVRKNLDVFGTLVLGVITAVGGGMLRDITLGEIPPALFRSPVYVAVAATAALALFVTCRFFPALPDLLEGRVLAAVLGAMDAVGLGFFTVVGVNTALVSGHTGMFLCTVVGVLTGVGGGMIRDLLAMRTPVVLQKHVYAVASMAGAVCCYCLSVGGVPTSASFLLSAGLVVAVRLLATHYRWNLPTARKRERAGCAQGEGAADEDVRKNRT